MALFAFAVFLLGCMYAPVWPFSFVAATVVILWVYLKMRDALRRCTLFEQIGHYALLLFLVNGIVRMPFVRLAVASPQSQLMLGFLSAAVSLSIAILTQEFLMPFLRTVGDQCGRLKQAFRVAGGSRPAATFISANRVAQSAAISDD